MMVSTAAASATVRAIGPAVSCSGEIGTMNRRETRPSVGLRPTTPFMAAGQVIEPSVSVPMAAVTRPAADGDRWAHARSAGAAVQGRRDCGTSPPAALQPLTEQGRTVIGPF